MKEKTERKGKTKELMRGREGTRRGDNRQESFCFKSHSSFQRKEREETGDREENLLFQNIRHYFREEEERRCGQERVQIRDIFFSSNIHLL